MLNREKINTATERKQKTEGQRERRDILRVMTQATPETSQRDFKSRSSVFLFITFFLLSSISLFLSLSFSFFCRFVIFLSLSFCHLSFSSLTISFPLLSFVISSFRHLSLSSYCHISFFIQLKLVNRG